MTFCTLLGSWCTTAPPGGKGVEGKRGIERRGTVNWVKWVHAADPFPLAVGSTASDGSGSGEQGHGATRRCTGGVPAGRR